MRRLLDTIVLVIVGVMAVHLLYTMLKPYALLIVLGGLSILFIERVVKHFSSWG